MDLLVCAVKVKNVEIGMDVINGKETYYTTTSVEVGPRPDSLSNLNIKPGKLPKPPLRK